MKKLIRLLLIVGILALFAIPYFGCAQAVDHTIANSIKQKLPSAIGPAEDYAVTVSANPLQAAQGKLREVDIVGTDVNLSSKLLVDQLSVQAHNIVLNTSTKKLTSVGDVSFQAQVGQDSINHYLEASSGDFPQKYQDLKVVLNDSSVTASMNVVYLGVNVPVSVTGTFLVSPDNDKLILFIPSKASLSIIPLPEFAVKLALRRINPVIDLSNATVPVDIASVSIESSTLSFTGSANLNHALAQGS